MTHRELRIPDHTVNEAQEPDEPAGAPMTQNDPAATCTGECDPTTGAYTHGPACPNPRRADLRDRIRRVFCERDGKGYLWGTDMLEPDEYGEDADAVLAVFFGPIPAGTDTATWTAIRAAQLMNEAGQQRDRYRFAWHSARERAQAYGEGILRVVKDRETYQEWLRQAEEGNAALLRRLAGEAQQGEMVPPAFAAGMPCEHGCRAAADELAREAQQDPAPGGLAPVGGVKGNPFDYHPEDEAARSGQPETDGEA
ncbi:hypothetical protein [Streptomyces misionensis]